MSKSTQIRDGAVSKVPTQQGDRFKIPNNSVGNSEIKDLSVDFNQLTTELQNQVRPISQNMIYTGPQFTVLTSHQVFKVAVPTFTMLLQPGRYRFIIRVMMAVSINAGNEVAITCALVSDSTNPTANLISQEYSCTGAVFNGFQTTPSNPGFHTYTEEIAIIAPTNIYFAQKHFVTSGVPGQVSLGIRGDLIATAAPTTVIEAIRLGDI